MLLVLFQSQGDPPDPVPAGSSMGFEMGGASRVYRETSFKPVLQRVLEAKAPKVKPKKERAAKRAKTIEQQAAIAVTSGIEEPAYLRLFLEWKLQQPYIPPQAQKIPLDEMFAAQVAFRIAQMQLMDDDDEEAVIAILLS